MLVIALVTPLIWGQAFIWGEYVQFYVGVALGVAIAMYLCLIDSPPEWIDRKRRGRDGEQRTEKQLLKLEKLGWTAAHDIQTERGNFDHLLVGPAGAFLLETKNYHGRAEIVDGKLLLRRGDDDRDAWSPRWPLDADVRRAAVEARNRLCAATGIRWVQGVIVLWSEFPQKVAELDRVVVVHGDHLAEWLRAQPQKLSPELVQSAGAYLSALERDEVAREELAAAA